MSYCLLRLMVWYLRAVWFFFNESKMVAMITVTQTYCGKKRKTSKLRNDTVARQNVSLPSRLPSQTVERKFAECGQTSLPERANCSLMTIFFRLLAYCYCRNKENKAILTQLHNFKCDTQSQWTRHQLLEPSCFHSRRPDFVAADSDPLPGERPAQPGGWNEPHQGGAESAAGRGGPAGAEPLVGPRPTGQHRQVPQNHPGRDQPGGCWVASWGCFEWAPPLDFGLSLQRFIMCLEGGEK